MSGAVALSAVLAAGSVAALLTTADDRLDVAVRGRPGTPSARDRGGGARTGSAEDDPAAARLSQPTAACLVAGAALALLVGSWSGAVLGLAVAVAGPRLLARLEPRRDREERERLLQDLPLVLDLLASCLAGGAPLPAAAAAVAQAVGGPAGRRLGAVGAALAVGAPPGEAWMALAGEDPLRRDQDPLAPAARALARAADGGAPVASTVSRLAAEARAEQRSRAEQAARRVGVVAVAPLGLCFLPAFVLLGVVPVVVGLAGPLLRSL